MTTEKNLLKKSNRTENQYKNMPMCRPLVRGVEFD